MQAAKDKGKEEERLGRGKESDDKRKPRESESRRSGSRERERHRDRDRDKHRDRGRDHRKPNDRDPRVGERVVIEAGHVLLMEGLVTEGSREVPFASTSLRLSVVSISLGSGALQTDRGRIVRPPLVPITMCVSFGTC